MIATTTTSSTGIGANTDSMNVSPTNFRQKSHMRHPFSKSKKMHRKSSFSVGNSSKKASESVFQSGSSSLGSLVEADSNGDKAASSEQTVNFKRLLRSLEAQQRYLPNPNYLKRVQDDSISETMRKDALVGIAKINAHLKYHPETFGIAVNLFDRCLSKIQVREVHLQLIATACFLIASKIGEKWLTHPRFKELCIAADHRFSCADIRRMESLLVKKLNWNLNPACSYLFVEQILSCCDFKSSSNGDGSDDGATCLLFTNAQERIEMTEIAYRLCSSAALSYRFLKYTPSVVALCSIMIASQHVLARKHLLNSVNLNEAVLKPMLEATQETKPELVAQCLDDLMKISAFM